MKDVMTAEISDLIKFGVSVDKHRTRSLMILVRKQLELMSETDRAKFATLNLFCNWCAHTEITQSQAGLKTLARINDSLVRVKTADTEQVQKELTDAIGFNNLRSELVLFLTEIQATETITSNEVWANFLDNLVSIIEDVPLGFPPLTSLKPQAQKIYNQIAKNPIKPGAGVINIVLSKVNYGNLGVPQGKEMMCLLVKTEDTTTLVVPLLVHL